MSRHDTLASGLHSSQDASDIVVDRALLTEEEENRIQELVEEDGAPGSAGGSVEDWQRREAEGSAWRCTQQPGEAVFVPDSFLHATINVEEGLAVAVQVRPQPACSASFLWPLLGVCKLPLASCGFLLTQLLS